MIETGNGAGSRVNETPSSVELDPGGGGWDIGPNAEFDPERGERQQNLDKFVKFLDNDMAVKKIMYGLAPSEEIDYNAEVTVQYGDHLYEGVEDARERLESMMDDFFPYGEPLKKRLEEIQSDVIGTGYDAEKMRQVYRTEIAAMDPNFVTQVTQKIAGFMLSTGAEAANLANEARSMNEILHLVHSYAMRSEEILASLPILKQDAERHNQLCGDETAQNAVAAQFYDDLEAQNSPLELESTTVVALKDRTLAMIRDYGHATMIDARKVADGYDVSYHLACPKNVEMTNRLPGVRKITDPFKATSGQFSIKAQNDNEAAQALTEFVFSIPTDDDIEMGSPSIE